MEGNDIETVEKTIDEIIAVDPKSPFAEQLESFKKTQLQEIKKQRAEQEKTEEKE